MPRTQTSNQPSVPLWAVVAISLVVALAAGVGLAIVFSNAAAGVSSSLPCVGRNAVIDTSSSFRSQEQQNAVLDFVVDLGVSSAICDEPLAVAAVAGGGQVRSILSSGDLGEIAPDGPSLRVRQQRFSADDRLEIVMLVEQAFATIQGGQNAGTTSILALLNAGAERSTPDSELIILTDGVNQDDRINLNRPLVDGEGARLAGALTPPSVAAKRIIIIGIGQIDSETAPPGATWTTEVRAFNQTLCEATAPAPCQLYSAATAAEALN